MNFIKLRAGDHSPLSVVRDEGFKECSDLLLLTTREPRGGFE